ncbi:unnamed protein product [Mytilus edulis]|uniref:B box-type domain-containing protein n=1 Tax=Mytilus edulis TaxID=6550 RepID=A0A8S3QW84_MYTED|nr:unnamed protein product [Mytilus edulis]
MLDGGRKQHTKNKQILLELEEEVITKAQKYAKKNLALVDSEWKTLEGSLKQEFKVLKTLRNQMVTDKEIISRGTSASEMLSKLYPSSENMHSPKKSVYQMVLKQISYDPKYEITQYAIELLIKRFSRAKKVLTLDNNQALIASEKDKIVQKIQFDNEDIKVLKTLPETTVYDMAKLDNGDILISFQENQLNIFREKNETIELFYSFSPLLKTFGIHVNEENEILVGLSAGFPDEEDKITKPGKIAVLNSEGNVKRTFEYGKKTDSKECLCTCPTRIVAHLDNTICFIDKITKNNKRQNYMASSKPEEKYSPLPLICQICDISSDLKWMCPECDLYFCANCELKFHRKNQTLSGHAKIDIEQCSTENINEIIRKAEIENISCVLHTEEKCNLFCKDCQNTVCKNCVSSGSHQNHELASLEDIFKEKALEKHNFQTRIESHIDHYTQTANEMEYMLEKATAKYKRTQENILQTEKQLITETKGYFKTIVGKIELEWENIEEMVKEEIKEAESKKGQLVKYDENLTQAIAPLKMLTTNYPQNLLYNVNESVYHHKLQQTLLERYQRHKWGHYPGQ